MGDRNRFRVGGTEWTKKYHKVRRGLQGVLESIRDLSQINYGTIEEPVQKLINELSLTLNIVINNLAEFKEINEEHRARMERKFERQERQIEVLESEQKFLGDALKQMEAKLEEVNAENEQLRKRLRQARDSDNNKPIEFRRKGGSA